ncbi:hypothetical protein D3C87_1051480 [compost metagenome]
MRYEGGIKGAEAVTGQVILGHRQFRVLRAHSLHHPVHVLSVFLGHAWGGEAGGGADEVETGWRRQLHNVIAGLVVELFQVFVEGAVITRAGAGDQEDQRCRFVLGGDAIGEFFHRPEVVWQDELSLRAQRQAAVRLIDVVVQRQFRAQVRRRRGDGRLERVGQGVAITGGIDIHRQCGRTQNKAAEQRGEAQGTEHD